MITPAEVLELVPGSGPSDWAPHANGGGWVYRTATVPPDAYVGSYARVYDQAEVYGKAHIFGRARVYGRAQVCDVARIGNQARVYGDAEVYGEALIYGDAHVYDGAHVYGHAYVYGDARVGGDSEVYGRARVYGGVWESSPLQIQGSKHFVSLSSYDDVTVGCTSSSVESWLEDCEEIGGIHGYTSGQIAEYREYVTLAAKYAERVKKGGAK